MEKPMFIMMCGLPGSGKSSNAKALSKIYNATICSSDAIREEVTGSVSNQDKDPEVFKILHDRIKENLSRGISVIYDACNISYKKRMAFLNEIKKYDCMKVCYFVYTPYEKVLMNNKNRENVVPEYAIKRMYKNMYVPQYFEGWDLVVMNREQATIKKGLTELFYGDDGMCKIEHDNPHHTLSIGDHCIACYLNILTENSGNMNFNLATAALLHDIGKPFTKGYKDSKGNESDHAHYYQHHLVSAYDAIEYLLDRNYMDILDIVAMITYHMHPYFWEKENNEKMKKKYRQLWGEKMFENIMKLHVADMKAH